MARAWTRSDVGRHALRGVRENALYVSRTRSSKPLIADRFAR